MAERFRSHVRSNVIGYIALLFAIGGVSYAAVDLSKNSVGAREIKKNAVRSSEVRNNTLKGRDVKEATFGQVPSALNADELDGLDSTAFQRARERVVQVGEAEAQNFPSGSTLAELGVAEGTYLALAKLSIIHPDAGNDATTTCDLSVPGPLDDSQQSRMGGGGTAADQLGFPLVTTFTGAGQISLSCTNPSGNNDAFNIKLIAVRVD
jgi:hypothetical protein